MKDRTEALTLAEKVEPAATALVVVDYQNDFVAPGGALDKAGLFSEASATVHGPILEAIGGARAAGAKVLFLRCEYNRPPDEPFLSDVWLDQARRRWHGLYTDIPVCVPESWGADFYQDVRPEPTDLVVTKHRFGAFQGTDLDLVLRTNGIRTLVFTGVVTHVCVESTVRQAFFHDYFSIVISDAVAGWNETWHTTSLDVMDWGFAEVVPLSRVLESW